MGAIMPIMRSVFRSAIVVSWFAAGWVATAGDARAPAGDELRLRRSEPAEEAAKPAVAPVPSVTPAVVRTPQVRATRASRVVETGAPETVSPYEPPEEFEIELKAPRDTRGAIPIDFLRRDDRNRFSDPVSGAALRDGAFGEMGKKSYKLPSVDGAAAFERVTRAARPVAPARSKEKFPITTISWAGILILGFFLGRRALQSFRRSRSGQAQAS